MVTVAPNAITWLACTLVDDAVSVMSVDAAFTTWTMLGLLLDAKFPVGT